MIYPQRERKITTHAPTFVPHLSTRHWNKQTLEQNVKELFELLRSQSTALKQDGSLASNITYVFGNKAIMLISSFFLMPVLSRIYDKEAFGTFGVLNNLILVSTTIIGFKLSEAFILEMKDERFKALARVSIHMVLLGVLVSFIIFAFCGPYLFKLLGVNVSYWVALMIPLFSGCFALEQIQVNYIRRLKEFKRSAYISSSMDLGSRIAAIGFGLNILADFSGLLFKELLRVLGNLFLRGKLILNGPILPVKIGITKWAEVRSIFKEYGQFPRYLMPSVLTSMLYGSVPFYFIGGSYGVDDLGDFTMAFTLLNFPVFILTNSIVSVFQRSAAEWVKNDTQKLKDASYYVLVLLTFISACGFGLVYWYGETIFEVFLGERWKTAGIMAVTIAPLFFARTVAPLAESLRVIFNTESLNLLFRVFGLIATLACFLLGIHFQLDLLIILRDMTVINCCLIIVSVFLILYRLDINLFKASITLALTIILGYTLAYIPTFFI